MKIGISALIFNLEEALEICKSEKAISHIEIGIDNLEECEKLHKYKEEFKKLELSIGIHLPMELNTCENIKFIRQSWVKFIQEMDFKLRCLDIKYFNFHLGYVISNRLSKNRDKYLEIATDFLKEVSSKIDTSISIENTYSKQGDLSNVGNIVYDFEYIFNKIENDMLWFCYDTGHNLINPDEYVSKLRSRVKIIHLSDNDGKEDIHIGIGKGELSRNHIKELLDLDAQYIVLEVNYNDIADSIKKVQDIIEEV